MTERPSRHPKVQRYLARVVNDPRFRGGGFRHRTGLRFRPIMPHCYDCGGDWFRNPAPVFKDSIWDRLGIPEEACLCDGCGLRRLGRPINLAQDLKPVPFNTMWAYGDSTFWKGPWLLRT